jgi:ABC-type transport system involved in multi-copper enzyme maturation permease subunit
MGTKGFIIGITLTVLLGAAANSGISGMVDDAEEWFFISMLTTIPIIFIGIWLSSYFLSSIGGTVVLVLLFILWIIMWVAGIFLR